MRFQTTAKKFTKKKIIAKKPFRVIHKNIIKTGPEETQLQQKKNTKKIK
jgi:hypothetical protein